MNEQYDSVWFSMIQYDSEVTQKYKNPSITQQFWEKNTTESKTQSWKIHIIKFQGFL